MMNIEHPRTFEGAADDMIEAFARGFRESASGFCLCDADDVIRATNLSFRLAFFPGFDGRPADFTETITAAMKAGAGIRVVSAAPEAFVRKVRQDRRALVGARSFAADMLDGSWWSVTDTKLSNGWILAVAQDISALKDEEARLRNAHDAALAEAQTDVLTGAASRRYGLRRAEAQWTASRSAGTSLTVALLDVDHFKTINDVHGHEAGDRALVHLTRWMIGVIGPEEAFCRLGGDEFMLVSAARAGHLTAVLSGVLKALPALDLDGRAEPLRLSISVGVAEGRSDDTWTGLMHRADMALYDAKAGGRDRIALAR